MPKISVIIPIYNVEQYLAKCLDSLVNQTLKDIEIICVNDCSTDNSLSIIEDYASKDNRIKIIDLKENSGAAVARNKGLEIAEGEYLGFVDPDDYVDLNFYEELYKKAIEDEADIVKAALKIMDIEGKKTISQLNNIIKKSNNKFDFSHEWWCAIYKKKLIDENNIVFPNECRKAQDIVFLNRCLIFSKKLSLIDNVFYYYIKREGSLDSSKLKESSFNSALLAVNIILEEINNAFENKTITKEQYNCAFGQKLGVFVYTFLQAPNEKAKNLCVENLFNWLDKCFFKEEIKFLVF